MNKKAGLYWQLRTLFEQGGIRIFWPGKLTEELPAIKYKVVDSTGKILITGKDGLRKPQRLGRSPDRVDSLKLAAARAPAEPVGFVMLGWRS